MISLARKKHGRFERSRSSGRRSPLDLWPFLGLLILLIGAALLVWHFNVFSLEIKLNGDANVLLEYGQPYSEPGASACFRGTFIRRDPVNVTVTTTGQVDPALLGEYTLTYEADYTFDFLFFHLPFHESCQRKVTVQDTQLPTITLVSDPEVYTIPGGEYQEEGFSAEDNYDGDITQKVIVTPGDGIITYTVADSSGNEASVVRQIRYHDPIAPVLELLGGESVTVMKGAAYQDPGYTALDNCDGDLTGSVTVTGNVDTSKLGSYELTYTVTDSYGNTDTKVRTVKVWMTGASLSSIPNLPKYDPNNPPEPNGKVIYLTFDDGPTAHTQHLLDILDAYGVKATFFVVSNGYSHMISKIAEAGHTVAMHTASHNYGKVYASDEAYFNDLRAIENLIIRETGSAPKLLRFPGGTANTVSRRYCTGIMTRVSQKLREMGYRYYDWHVSSEDAVDAYTVKAVYDNVVSGIRNRSSNSTVVLQHDTNEASVNAVEAILIWGLANGYSFQPITENSPGCTAKPAN